MRRFCILAVALVAGLFVAFNAAAAEYRLLNGDVIRGEPASYSDDGVAFRLDIGGFSPRITWGKFTQDTLKQLASIPEARRYAEPFIEIPPEVKQKERAKKREVVIKPVPRVEVPAERKKSAFSGFGTPVGLLIVGLLFAANIFAGYEVAVYRNRPPLVACLVSAVLPVAGPLIFLSLPTLGEPGTEHLAPAAPAEAELAASSMATVPGMAATGLSIAAADAKTVSGGAMEQGTYKRGDTTFNRRFFETKFPGFFRVVPSEAEKDLVLVVRTPKQEYVAKRISRISAGEMHLQLLRGATEVSVSFGEITEVQVRNKDAKA